jgi:hypothetical protein
MRAFLSRSRPAAPPGAADGAARTRRSVGGRAGTGRGGAAGRAWGGAGGRPCGAPAPLPPHAGSCRRGDRACAWGAGACLAGPGAGRGAGGGGRGAAECRKGTAPGRAAAGSPRRGVCGQGARLGGATATGGSGSRGLWTLKEVRMNGARAGEAASRGEQARGEICDRMPVAAPRRAAPRPCPHTPGAPPQLRRARAASHLLPPTPQLDSTTLHIAAAEGRAAARRAFADAAAEVAARRRGASGGGGAALAGAPRRRAPAARCRALLVSHCNSCKVSLSPAPSSSHHRIRGFTRKLARGVWGYCVRGVPARAGRGQAGGRGALRLQLLGGRPAAGARGGRKGMLLYWRRQREPAGVGATRRRAAALARPKGAAARGAAAARRARGCVGCEGHRPRGRVSGVV